MSENNVFEDDEVSLDFFSQETLFSSPGSSQCDTSSVNIPGEPVPTETAMEWKGVSMNEIYRNLDKFQCQQLPPIMCSKEHTVLFELPQNFRGPPKAYPSYSIDKWSPDFVRMPHSEHSLINDTEKSSVRIRWHVIEEKLLASFMSSQQLEAAILSYNNKYAKRWNFAALHHLFSEEVGEEERDIFFNELLPKIITLALRLPQLVTTPIPLLKQHRNASVSLSQLQVACLLANAFLCTFPRRNSSNPQSEYASYPNINFNRLFSAFREDKMYRCRSVTEKLKCIIHYFRRVTTKEPEGTITIQRRYIPRSECPKWTTMDQKLPPMHITSSGTIESEGAGLLQVDFANKYLGGGVLNWGCVQEEIRFVICPELMVTMLVTEALDDTEAVIISGVERYSKYEGYGNTFTWTGDYVDETPRDSSGRRKTSIVAIDALYFRQPDAQFNMGNITRELNKAYVGFSTSEVPKDLLPAIATGNWGCGAFRGNPQLKVLLQLMAAAVAGRALVYFTFGDVQLRDEVAALYTHLLDLDISVGRLYKLLSQYREQQLDDLSDFYPFLYNRSKMKTIDKYFFKQDNPRNKEKIVERNGSQEDIDESQETVEPLLRTPPRLNGERQKSGTPANSPPDFRAENKKREDRFKHLSSSWEIIQNEFEFSPQKDNAKFGEKTPEKCPKSKSLDKENSNDNDNLVSIFEESQKTNNCSKMNLSPWDIPIPSQINGPPVKRISGVDVFAPENAVDDSSNDEVSEDDEVSNKRLSPIDANKNKEKKKGGPAPSTTLTNQRKISDYFSRRG